MRFASSPFAITSEENFLCISIHDQNTDWTMPGIVREIRSAVQDSQLPIIVDLSDVSEINAQLMSLLWKLSRIAGLRQQVINCIVTPEAIQPPLVAVSQIGAVDLHRSKSEVLSNVLSSNAQQNRGPLSVAV